MEKNPAGVPDELRKVEDIARKTVKEIRHMLFTLRPLILESQGLAAALSQLAEKVHETHGQAVATRVGQNVENVLDQHQQGVIFYIVEEAINNARKHAQAELISVNVGLQEDVVIVQIADNGVGFNTTAVDTNYEQRGSLGMVNMRERAALLDGTLQIESTPGKGTKVMVVAPIKNGGSNGSSNGARGGGVAISPGDRYNPQSR
jgi:signal transduction histidine kinase